MRFCSHCGRLYDENIGKCSCRKNDKPKYKKEGFYESVRWKKLAKFIKVRDLCLDRLALYLLRSDTVQNENENESVYKMLHDYLIDVDGRIRYEGKLICHHIVPREDDYNKQWQADNLITVNFFAHEFIHLLYLRGKKKEVQQILVNAVQATLP